MTKYLLHGGFTRVRNELNDSFFKEFVKDIPDGSTILMIYFAVEDKHAERFEVQKNQIRENSGRDFAFEMAAHDTLLEQVARASAVYIQGGNTGKLLEELRKYPEFGQKLVGKTVAGSSAGAYALSTYYYSLSPTPGVYEGLGIVPVRVICHYESETPEHVPGDEALAAFDAYPHDLELVVLRDYEWRMFEL